MGKVRVSVAWARLRRARARLVVAVAAITTAVRHLHGWPGWAVGVVAAVGVMLFEFRQWWDYLSDGKREGSPPEPQLSGSARFREPGTTAVRLLATGDRPELVARRLRFVTDLDDAQIADLMKSTPVNLPGTLSLRSAERVVDGLRHAGAESQVLIQGIIESGHGT